MRHRLTPFDADSFGDRFVAAIAGLRARRAGALGAPGAECGEVYPQFTSEPTAVPTAASERSPIGCEVFFGVMPRWTWVVTLSGTLGIRRRRAVNGC